MAERTNIEWTDTTWSCITGCERCSPGCNHCYAEQLTATRLREVPKYQGLAVVTPSGPRWTGEVRVHDDELLAPLRWRKPRRVFVNSMSDTFHEDVPDEFLDRMFAVMALSPRHTFQVLTKRAGRMLEYFGRVVRPRTAPGAQTGNTDVEQFTDEYMASREYKVLSLISQVGSSYADSTLRGAAEYSKLIRHYYKSGVADVWPLPNVWLGVSVEDQKRADERIPLLLQTPAAVRFLSCEPLLGPVGLGATVGESVGGWLSSIDWVIVGGESGVGARPCRLSWIRSLVHQCREAGVACFTKQVGSNFHSDGEVWPTAPRHTLTSHRNGLLQNTTELSRCQNGRWKLRDRKGGWMGEWPEDIRVRQWPVAAEKASARCSGSPLPSSP